MTAAARSRDAEPYDLVAIGGGSAGLAIGKWGTRLGARVAIVEAARMGGDCTWYGCVPSKALLAAAHAAHNARRTARFGLPDFRAAHPIDLAKVLASVHELQEHIYRHDDAPEVLRAKGVDVIEGRARFVSPSLIEVDGRPLPALAYCLATGATPAVPPIPGLEAAPWYTTETVFTELRVLPERLLVLGGGPVGVELAQAYARLGSAVTVVEQEERLLPAADPDLAAVLRPVLAGEGIAIATATTVERFEQHEGRHCARLRGPEGDSVIEFDALLVAAGRRPRSEGLGLDVAGIELTEAGAVRVDTHLRTSNPHVFACGDVIGGSQFTHTAAYEASVVLRNALLPFGRGPLLAKVDYSAIPAVTFTDPEIASAGLTPRAARARHGERVRVERHEFASVDRAVAERETAGFAQVVTLGAGGRVLGAQIAGAAAGELIEEFALAMRSGTTAAAIAQTVHAYPTRSLGPHAAALASYEASLRSPRMRLALGALRRLRRWRG